MPPTSPDRLPDAPVPGLGWRAHPLARAVAFPLCFTATALAISPLGHDSPAWVWAVMQLFCTVVAYLLVVVLMEGRAVPHELAPRRVGGLVTGLVTGAVGCLLVFALCWLVGWRTVTGVDPSAPVWLPLLQVGIVAGISEEIIFRGILFRLAERGLGTWGALLLSALLFGMVHLHNPEATWWGAVAIAVEAGLGLGLFYALTRSLWVVIGVHAAWNVVQGPLLGSAISGATANGDGLVQSFPKGPEALSGGDFGLESSLAAVVVWLTASAWLLTRLRANRHRVLAPAWRRHSPNV